MTIQWDYVYRLSSNEFSEDPDKYAEPELIYSLSTLRKLLGVVMLPSPVPGALARDYGSKRSQHYAIDRLSTASDMFIEGSPFEIFSKIIFTKLFTGIGIYLDTNGPDGKPWVMFHLDIRKHDSFFVWIVEKVNGVDKYRYPYKNPKYWKLLNDERFYSFKKFSPGSS